MGSTIVTNRCAAVFDNPRNRGDHIWVLFEKCYESNVYPHTPRWSARMIGRIREVMQLVFHDAACCEGGMLRDRSGSISPETHIRRWHLALRHPVEMPPMDIRVKREDFRGRFRMVSEPTDDELWDEFSKRMREHGRADIPLVLDAGKEVTLSLHEDIEIVISIYGYGRERQGLLAPWKAFGGEWAPEHAPKSTIGYYPSGGQIPAPVIPRAYRIDENALVMPEGGKWRAAGWAYSAIGEYVRGLWETELHAPGGYEVLIAPYREAVRSAPLLPRGSEAEVDLTNCRSRENVLEAVGLAGGRIEKDPESGKELALIPWSVEIGRKLACLPYEATTWHVPEVSLPEPARLCA
ncbi:MAG: hypothetical protein ACP5P4_15920 [Steroidobacteraceae bacterium]